MGIPSLESSEVKEKSIAPITSNKSHLFSYIIYKLNQHLNRNFPGIAAQVSI